MGRRCKRNHQTTQRSNPCEGEKEERKIAWMCLRLTEQSKESSAGQWRVLEAKSVIRGVSNVPEVGLY